MTSRCQDQDSHGISAGVYQLFFLYLALHLLLSVESSVLQQQPSRLKRSISDSILGEYHECNDEGGFWNSSCVCLGCYTDIHRSRSVQRGSDIACCYTFITDIQLDSNIQMTILDSQYANYTAEFERHLKEVIVASVIEFCNEEQHQQRCQEFDINTLVPQDMNVYELLSRLVSGSSVLQIRFAVYVYENLSWRRTRRHASLPVYPSEKSTVGNGNTEKTAPMWSHNPTLLELSDDAAVPSPDIIRRKRSGAMRVTITGEVVMDAMEAHRQIIMDRLQVDYQLEIVSENFKSQWEKMSIAVKCVVVIVPVVVGSVCIVLCLMFDKMKK